MKFVSFLTISLIVMISFQLSFSKDIVDKKSYSKLKTVPNKILVRLYPEISKSVFFKKIDNNSIYLEKALLKKEESITYNELLKKKTFLQKKLNVEKIIKSEEPLLRTFIIHYIGNLSPEIYANQFKRVNPEVEIAEPIYINQVNEYFPDDPYAGQQGILHTCDLLAAWEIEDGDTNVVIGISDVGCDQAHEDLKDNIATNWADPVNGVDDDHNGYVDDFNGIDLCAENTPLSNTYASDSHGTNVAGIASAVHNNALGMAGASYKCRFFPIKVSKDNELVNAYDSFIYAGKQHFKVMNCSWGIEKTYSDIEQSMINYAVANDVAVVASAGNTDYSVNKNYPSAYDNVMAVSEVNQADNFTANNIGEYVDILAPGIGNWHTNNGNNYSNSGAGTSYSAPVIAGILALVRSKYPYLNALQAIELLRQSTNKVADLPNNALWVDILPGRVNAYKALTTDPFSIPSIRPEKVVYKDKSSNISERFKLGDTGFIEIDAYNYLGDYDSITVEVSAVWDDEKTIEILDSLLIVGKVLREKEIKLSGFSFKKVKENQEKIFFRFDIRGAQGYKDFFLVEFFPSPIITNFSNKSIAFSASDRGTIGTGGDEDNIQGIGFQYKDQGNQLWKSCFLASDLMESLVSSLGWASDQGDLNDFEVVKPLISPDKNIGIFNDSKASAVSKIGIEVKQEYIVPVGFHSIAKINIEVKNTSSPNIPDLSSGYYFDWDIKNSDSNFVSLVPDAIPEHLKKYPSAVQMVQYSGANSFVVGCGVISFEPNGKAQAAGINNYTNSINDDSFALDVLKKGTTLQDVGITDVSVFVGMLFEGNLPLNASKKYSICFGGAETEKEFIEAMKTALDTTYTGIDVLMEFKTDFKIFPNPANDLINLEIVSNKAAEIQITIIDLLGNIILRDIKTLQNAGKIYSQFNSSNIQSGNYLIVAKLNNQVITKTLNIIK